VTDVEAILVQEHGGPEVLALAEADAPEPTPGGEGAGTVITVGEGVETSKVGDRVASTELAGSYAQFAVAAADRVVAVPDGISDEVAAAALLQGMTAHYLLYDSYPVRSGETVLVHAAAGGMGLLLTQLASKLGARVIGTVSAPDKEKLARQAGAAEVIGYDDVAARVRELTGGEGVPAVYDGVGRDTFDASLASLRPRGTLVLYGYASGSVPPFDLNRLQLGGSLYVTRPTLAHFVASQEDLTRRAHDVLGWVADGSLHITVGGRYPLAEARRAHEDLEARRTTGKLLLIP
jgi:NADPH:quinone reductase